MALIDPSTITAETSLWEIWNAARRVRRNAFNQWTLRVTAAVAVLYVLTSKQSAHEFAEMLRVWANIGLGFSAQILGFLVAGFTIFATLSKPAMLASMAAHQEKKSGLSYLKYNFFVFFETFGWYVGFAGLCVIILLFGAPGGAVTQLSRALGSFRHPFEVLLTRGCTVVVAVWFVLLCLELKSFVFNIYHVVMTSIRWTVEFDEAETTPRYAPPKNEEVRQTSSAATQVHGGAAGSAARPV
ncbi:MAG TPA: hypothetical protein VGR35_00195 [Tepidisphaeraceae bacterium]|nr:hypothetical protein [Tepidisphaeraceae bacterium]